MAVGVLGPAQVLADQQGVTTKGRVTIYSVPAREQQATSIDDMIGAKAMPLPSIDRPPARPAQEGAASSPIGPAGSVPGSRGTGERTPVTVPLDESSSLEELLDDGFTSQEYGTANHPYTTARVDTVGNNVSKTAPYRAAGKLYFKDGTSSFVCSAALIKRGVIATAAHCVAKFGARRYYTNFQFVPAKYNTLAPYGVWVGEQAFVLTSYFNGTDSCAPGASGVVCRNDVAVIRLQAQSGAYPGTATGWFGYGWNGYGFTPNNLALINQLGYPVSHDGGNIMQRTDSQGFVAGTDLAGNTVWGSRQTGGSSGGPEVVNLGIKGSLTTPLGSEPNQVIIGVTSWGYKNAAVKQQGASPFLNTNIVTLVNTACASSNPACL